ncbi:hypothetical protein I8D64_00300 [Brachybacterium sp. MASK1Z-5]|uniref:Alkaline shock response membrane anchor protein AmaP n=1 Tax=Brachybacterium halotolerans TaxID=2795215 RepID=A0ABS1B5D9_9MICO|nr:hypothetical protein [Brachybacterium halotolerans]MBK0329846.1 hypothetical protein [Brachybacterium halotolerans]
MRSVSGARNRLLLVLAGIIALLVGLWLAAGRLDLAGRWPGADAVLPHGDSTPAALADAHHTWILPVACVVAVLAVIVGIWLLVLQVPRRTPSVPLRITAEGSRPLGTLAPSVLERALAEHIEGIPGVLDASVQVSGATSSPWVQASVSTSQDAETAWVVAGARQLLADDVFTVLGAAPRHVDLLLSLRSAASSSRTRIDESPATASGGPGTVREGAPVPAR